MKTVPTNENPCKTTGALIETIRRALDGDGSYIAPGSIDSQGMTVVAGCYRFRLELGEPEVMDWEEHTPSDPDRDWMGDTDSYARGLDFDDANLNPES